MEILRAAILQGLIMMRFLVGGGLALAEATGLPGIFLVGENHGKIRLGLLVVSLLSVLALAPAHIGRMQRGVPYQRNGYHWFL